MRIDKNNYEEYVIDFLEGNLPEDVQHAFELFLEKHPKIQDEIIGLDEAILQPEESISFDKSSLIQKELPFNAEELEQKLIAKLEGDCTVEESLELENLIQTNSEVAKQWKLLNSTVLHGEEENYEEKEGLVIPKTIDYSKPENLIIGQLEGDLNASQTKQASTLLATDATAQKTSKYISLTKLSASAIVYPDKASLLQTAVVPMWRKALYYSSAAAAILLFVTIFASRETEQGIAIRELGDDPIEITKTVGFKDGDSSTTKESNTEDDQEYIPLQQDTPVQFANNDLNPNSEDGEKSGSRIKENIAPMKSVFTYDFASLNRFKENQIQSPDVLDSMDPFFVDLEDNEPSYAVNTPNAKSYNGVWDLAKDKAKGTLWGDEDYPKEDYALALADKTVGKVSEKSNVFLDVDRDKEDRSWSFQVGKFGVSHKKGA